MAIVKPEDTKWENKILSSKQGPSPPIAAQLQEMSNNLKQLSTPTYKLLDEVVANDGGASAGQVEPKTCIVESSLELNEERNSPTASRTCYSGAKHSSIQEYLSFINSTSKEELKGLKGIGEKRATYILELREESPEPFKSVSLMI